MIRMRYSSQNVRSITDLFEDAMEIIIGSIAMRQGHWANNSASTLPVFCCGQIPKSHWLMKVLLHVSWWILGEVGWDVWVSRMQVVEQICAMFCCASGIWVFLAHATALQVFISNIDMQVSLPQLPKIYMLSVYFSWCVNPFSYVPMWYTSVYVNLIASIYTWFHPKGIFVGVLII